ncbi:hypothetical protein JXD20_00505 [Candidatus Peregrinibacteria bacterium]|nr:hypothetical protein [Candidatus Peregrinibacteria bacterium]
MTNEYQKCLNYIKDKWERLTFEHKKDHGVHIGLPNKFVAPGAKRGIFRDDQFYWDSYFIILGLLVAKKINLAKGMVDNFAHLQKRFGIIPLRNRFFNLGSSQPPFLSSMVLEIYEVTKDKKWLRRMAEVIEKELLTYWMDTRKAERHLVYSGLSRYCDHHVNHITAEHESGWDMTSRFDERCLDFLPVDLNCLLYKYEIDLALIYSILKNMEKVARYAEMAKKRKKRINKLMWSKSRQFFFDYDYYNKKRRYFYSLAGFYPMWANLATPMQAKRCRDELKRFEYQYGLANSQKKVNKRFKQWDYPNGWPNQQWIVIQALLNYGYIKDAKRIAKKWLDMNNEVFKNTGKLWEKYNVVTGGIGQQGRYPNQTGFGWTNAIFLKMVSLMQK